MREIKLEGIQLGLEAILSYFVFFIFIFFKIVFLQKYIFGFIIYRFIPLPPSRRAVGALM